MRLPSVVLRRQIVGEVAKEVVPEYARNAQQQFGVHGLPVEYVIDVSAFAMQFVCKPCHGVCLGMLVQFGFYHLSNVPHFLSAFVRCHPRPHRDIIYNRSDIKKRRTMCRLSYPRHRQTPNLKQTVHSYALPEYQCSLAGNGYTTSRGAFLTALSLR